MFCCSRRPQLIGAVLLGLGSVVLPGCTSGPGAWWPRSTPTSETPAVPDQVPAPPGQSSPSDILSPTASRPPGFSRASHSTTRGASFEAPPLPTPADYPGSPDRASTLHRDDQRTVAHEAGSAAGMDETGERPPWYFTSSGNSPPADLRPSSPSGPFFPDSVPEIRADDPVMQGPSSPQWQVTVEPFEPARILARVGSEVILAGDVLGPVNQALAPYAGKVSAEQMAQQRELLVRQQLMTVIESKLMYLAFLRQIPDKSRDVAEPQIWKQVHEKFDDDELPRAMERAEVQTPQELDAKLREYGWSIAKQRRTYGERALGMEGALQSIDREPVVTHQEMLDYYEEHADQYGIPAAARWEQLSVRFDRMSSRQEAYDKIVGMGNEIVLGGAPFWAVAQRDSDDIQAEHGGVHDWTTQGSLASKVLDQAVFQLPIGKMSEIIEDTRGFHILRVLERREEGKVPFTEAQVEIRKKIQGQKRQQQFREYTEKLRREIPVWTIYDDEGPRSAQSGPEAVQR